MGNKKALLIGINYKGTGNELKGCLNDVKNMFHFLTTVAGYPAMNIAVMTEESPNPAFIPTGRNILTAFRWLMRNNRPGDSLFLHYSGHGGRLKGDDPGEIDDTIIPLDFRQNGQLNADLLHRTLVSKLPPGVKMTVVMDCCHSGSILELPYTFRPDATGKIQPHEFAKKAISAISSTAVIFNKNRPIEDKLHAAHALFNDVRDLWHGFKHKPEAGVNEHGLDEEEQFTQEWASDGKDKEIYCFSGCMDEQTSADTQVGGTPVGAMSWAFLASLQQNPQQSYSSLLRNTRQMLKEKYSQIPQLSVGRANESLDVLMSF